MDWQKAVRLIGGGFFDMFNFMYQLSVSAAKLWNVSGLLVVNIVHSICQLFKPIHEVFFTYSLQFSKLFFLL